MSCVLPGSGSLIDAYLDRAYDDVTKHRFGLFWAYTGVLAQYGNFAST